MMSDRAASCVAGHRRCGIPGFEIDIDLTGIGKL